MSIVFVIIAALMLVSSIAAMALRNLVHCALCAALAFAALAALFLQLGAQFVGFAQILVYVGAVAILIVFAILLTRGSEPSKQPLLSRNWWAGLGTAGLVFFALTAAILTGLPRPAPARTGVEVAAAVTVENIGIKLMTDHVLALEVVALLLTAALIGAVVIAMEEREGGK
jgi:NADH-quinone oxidoreductase subunit J